MKSPRPARWLAPAAAGLLLLVAAAPASAVVNSAPSCTWDNSDAQTVAPTTGSDDTLYINSGNLHCTDAEEDPLALRVVAGPSRVQLGRLTTASERIADPGHTVRVQGSAAVRAAGAVTPGADSIVVRVTDGRSETGDIVVPFTVAAAPPAPSCETLDTITFTYRDRATGVWAMCSGKDISYTITSPPAHGQLLPFDGAGDSGYLPDAGFVGTDSYTLLVDDGRGHTQSATRSIRVDAPGTPECEQDMAYDYSVVQGETTGVGAVGCWTNGAEDTRIELVGHDAVGTFAAAAGDPMELTYTAPAGFTGDVRFSYRVASAQGASNTVDGVIHVTDGVAGVSPVQCWSAYDAPATRTSRALDIWIDCAGTNVTPEIVDQPAHGTLTLGADLNAVYTPAPGFTGIDTYTYRANGAGGPSATRRAYVQVLPDDKTAVAANDRPICAGGMRWISDAGQNVYDDCWDRDGDPLTVTLGELPTHGTATVSGAGIPYVPAAGFTGLDRYTASASDGTLSSRVAATAVWVRRLGAVPLTPAKPSAPVAGAPATKVPAPALPAAPKGGKLLTLGGVQLIDTGKGKAKGKPGVDALGVDAKTGTMNLGTAYNSLTVPVAFGATATKAGARAASVRVAFTAAKKQAGKAVVLGSIALTLKPGQAAPLRFRLTAKARRALGAAKTVKATIAYTARPRGGKLVKATKKITLKVGKAKATKKKAGGRK